MSNANTCESKRSISLFAAICMMTGCIVGASVFVVPGELAVSVGPAAWLSYGIGAVLMFFNCFIFAQVGAVLPVSGANYMLCTGTVSGTWGFLYVWGFLLSNSFLFPIMSRTAATYLSIFFPVVGNHMTLVAVVIILFTEGINLLGTNVSTKIQNACVVLLIAVVIIFSGGGITHADWTHFEPMFPTGVMPVVLGAISTYYAFAGVNCIIELSGEIKNPGKNIPRTVFISFAIVIVMYIGMCVGLVALLPSKELNVSMPAIVAAEQIFPKWFSYFIALASIAACWTTLNSVMAAMARLLFMLGETSVLPRVIAKTNKNRAPYVAYACLSVMGILMILFSVTVMQYVNISSFYLLFVAFLVAFASLKIKKAFPERYEKSEYKLRGIWYYLWPYLAIISGFAFMFLQVREDPFMTGVSIVLLPVGALLYQLRKKQLKASGTDLDEEIKKRL